MLLADLAFFNQLSGFFEHCRPVISLSWCLCGKGPGSDMVTANTFMHLSEHIIDVFLSHSFKDGCQKALFI